MHAASPSMVQRSERPTDATILDRSEPTLGWLGEHSVRPACSVAPSGATR
jgi:hypothetical protein